MKLLSVSYSDCMVWLAETTNTDEIKGKTWTLTHCYIFILRGTKYPKQDHQLYIFSIWDSNKNLIPLCFLLVNNDYEKKNIYERYSDPQLTAEE